MTAPARAPRHPFRWREPDAALVTAQYRRAKKRQAQAAGTLGALRAEVANLNARARQMESDGRDASQVRAAAVRAETKLDAAAQEMEAAANDYRVAHFELLMTPAAQGHYVTAISKQQLLANLSEDDDEIAALTAMRGTLSLILAIAEQRRTQGVTGDAGHTISEEMLAGAAAAATGVFQTPDGRIHELRNVDGTPWITRGSLGPLPYDYVPGMSFGAGQILLNPAVQLQRHVEAGEPTGYRAACSLIL